MNPRVFLNRVRRHFLTYFDEMSDETRHSLRMLIQTLREALLRGESVIPTIIAEDTQRAAAAA